MSFFSVGLSALNAAQLGLTTTGQNISNANTVGYHRETAIQATNVSVQTGSGFVGQGVNVSTITRMYSQFLDTQVQQAQAQSSSLNAYQTQIAQIDNLLADPSAGLSPSLQGFFTAVSNVASNPQLVSARQSMLSAGNSLAASFQNLGAAIHRYPEWPEYADYAKRRQHQQLRAAVVQHQQPDRLTVRNPQPASQ